VAGQFEISISSAKALYPEYEIISRLTPSAHKAGDDVGRIADRFYRTPVPGADWKLAAKDQVAVALSLALSRHVPNWLGATDEQPELVAAEIIAALDAPTK
jgi:hypothetical protein